MIKRYYIGLLFFLLIGVLQEVQAKTVVRVAHSSFQPPFLTAYDPPKGLAVDFVAMLNAQQSTYHFELIVIPSRRLLARFQELEIDLVIFNALQWGWSSYGAEGSLALSEGKDVFFRALDVTATQRAPKRIAAVRGFHYSFANFDSQALDHLPHVALSTTLEGVVEHVIHGRAKTGITSQAYLRWLELTNPDLYSQLIIMDKTDQRYIRRVIRLATAPITTHDLNMILHELVHTGKFAALYAKYGMVPPPWTRGLK